MQPDFQRQMKQADRDHQNSTQKVEEIHTIKF